MLGISYNTITTEKSVQLEWKSLMKTIFTVTRPESYLLFLKSISIKYSLTEKYLEDTLFITFLKKWLS